MSLSGPFRHSRIPVLWVMAMAAMLLESGCAHRASLVRSQNPNRGTTQLVADSPRDAQSDADSESDSGYMGPMERALKRTTWERKKADAVAQGEAFTIEGLHEYQAAEALYLDGRLPEAEKAFNKLAKARRNRHESFNMKIERWWGVKSPASLDTYTNFGDPIEEDSLFMKAECQFDQKKYATAQDSYDALLTRYPSTRHLDAVSRRYFQIARYWLGFPEAVQDSGDVELVSGSNEEPQDFENVDSFYIPIIPNFLDKTRPAFDTRGRALQALRSVWLHDATGPLADDALMVSASFHLRTKDFEESARLYKLLREQYPESPHFRDAFLLGSHVTLASYQGSNYDGQSLDEAIDLKESALRIFPDLTEEERDRLGGELQKMYDAEVARIWDRVEYFQAKQAPESVAMYCKILINRFPDTVYGERAREILEAQAAAGSGISEMNLPQWATRDRESQAAEQANADVEPRVEEKKVPLKFPKLWWPARPVPEEEAPREADLEATEDMPSEEASEAERPAAGRATLE
jgi:tetratricopeptide (TPR) repeat protein